MHCRTCGTALSIQDFVEAEWNNEVEEFKFICPSCKNETKLISFLFEQGHISDQYLETIMLDTEEMGKEKYLTYMPIEQKNILITHLSNCAECSERLETLRLDRVTEKISSHEKVYSFFMSQGKIISKILTCSEFTLNGIGIKSFFFDGSKYTLNRDNLFYNQELEKNKQHLCYFLEKNTHIIGMVSFIKESSQICLDKIWLKTKERIEKEKEFFRNLTCADVKILYDLVKKK